MVSYYVTAGACLFLLTMMPMWSSRPDQTYPIWVIGLLAVVVLLVPLFVRRRRREGAAAPGDPTVTIENRD